MSSDLLLGGGYVVGALALGWALHFPVLRWVTVRDHREAVKRGD